MKFTSAALLCKLKLLAVGSFILLLSTTNQQQNKVHAAQDFLSLPDRNLEQSRSTTILRNLSPCLEEIIGNKYYHFYQNFRLCFELDLSTVGESHMSLAYGSGVSQDTCNAQSFAAMAQLGSTSSPLSLGSNALNVGGDQCSTGTQYTTLVEIVESDVDTAELVVHNPGACGIWLDVTLSVPECATPMTAAPTTAAPTTAATVINCEDRKDRFQYKVGSPNRKWCTRVSKKAPEDIPRECSRRNLTDHCPQLCKKQECGFPCSDRTDKFQWRASKPNRNWCSWVREKRPGDIAGQCLKRQLTDHCPELCQKPGCQ